MIADSDTSHTAVNEIRMNTVQSAHTAPSDPQRVRVIPPRSGEEKYLKCEES